MIDKATVQKIKDTADIVDVVSDYVHLVRRGANYMGLCPFHNERTPSFSVNKARNFCYCFSCHKGGSPVNFIMEKEGISYHEALITLAKKYGIKVEEVELTDEQREEQTRREGMYVANEWAMKYFEHNLTETQPGRDIGLQYLYGRGITEEAIKAFHLGYAIDNSQDFVEAAKKKGFSLDILKTLGLIGTSQQGRDYDRFRGRVIFPVLNSSGKVVAFGGRDLKGGPAKYINSPESELYKKSYELYGMYQARSAIVREDRCYLVEGYLDVIGMWQTGMKNVVASSGTALTDGQISLIHRFTKNVTLIYDGDAAGIKASLRGIDMLLSHNLDVKVLLLPDGDDPDSFARKHTPEEFREYVKEHETDIIRFKTRILMDEAGNDPQRRVEAIRSVVQSLACIPEKMKRDVYVQECSVILNVSEESVSASTAKVRRALEEQQRKQRRLREFDRENGTSPEQPGTQDITDNERGALDVPIVEQKPVKRTSEPPSPLRPLEWEVLEYCIKYGFLDFCESEDENGDKRTMSVIEFVDAELMADDISFSIPDFGILFDLLMKMLPPFYAELENFARSLTPEIEKWQKDGYDEIASRQLSVGEIKKAEDKLKDEIDIRIASKIKDFRKSYPSRMLASHENDMVRYYTTEAIRERHTLSNIYSREHPIENEEDKLPTLLPTAITVWKNGILEQQFKNHIKEFQRVSLSGDLEQIRKMQAELNELIRMRSEVAKNIGDRILSPVHSRITRK